MKMYRIVDIESGELYSQFLGWKTIHADLYGHVYKPEDIDGMLHRVRCHYPERTILAKVDKTASGMVTVSEISPVRLAIPGAIVILFVLILLSYVLD